MRWLLLLIMLIISSVFGAYIFLKGQPYRLYSQWVRGEAWDFYYRIPNYRPFFLAPEQPDPIPPYKEDYLQLWKDFSIGHSRMPLPTRHPLFKTIPIVELKDKQALPNLGMQLVTSGGREVIRLYNMPLVLLQDHTLGQELFKLPYVRNRLLKLDSDEVWNAVFTHKIEVHSKSLSQMIFDLYVLHLRSKLLPKETMRYGLISEGKVLIELLSADKDYMLELVLKQERGMVYSYLLRSDRQHAESQKLRSKFLESISFSPLDQAMGKIIYQEFKHLNFARQVDQEGMLYLFSSWTQDPTNAELLREMIFYLEKGKLNAAQLRVLYDYAFKKYGTTLTARTDFEDDEDPGIALQRKIEMEKKRNRQVAEGLELNGREQKPLNPKEKMNIYLKKAKEGAPAKTRDMTIH
jgi:hypothetical protein